MPRHRILLQTNPTHLKTGLAENARTLLRHLWKTGKYDIAHYCSQVSVADPQLRLTPWKSFGCLPADQQSINELNSDPNRARNAAYGAWNIDNVIREWKPTIYIGSDDIWGFTKGDYFDKPWWKQINSVLHITIDSVPILNLAFEQAKSTLYYLTWAKFAVDEMKRDVRGGKDVAHVSQIYGAMDTSVFSPISAQEKANLRARFSIDQDTVVFQYVFRNQLRKSAPLCIEAFVQFRKDNPTVKAKLHFHTCFSEQGNGWDMMHQMRHYGMDPKDLLCTYVCKSCGQWFISPYGGEDINCPVCHAEKSVVTTNIINGVPGDQMRFIYGIADAGLSIFTSGGQELTSCQTLLCGLPLACTNYSCGEDFCTPETKGFVSAIRYRPYHEAGTNFVKAASDTGEIARFMTRIATSSKRDLQVMGEKGRAWAVKTFGIETIGAQWEALFDSMPVKEWSATTLNAPRKNDTFPMPGPDVDNDRFISTLYKEVLNMDEQPNGEGFRHWQDKLRGGVSRNDVYKFFIQVAQQENQKNGVAGSAPADFSSLLDNTGKKRALLVIRESIGDCLMMTSLFESFHEKHSDYDLYIGTDPKYASIFDGNPFVHKVIPYIPAMEQEMAMIGAGQKNGYFSMYMHPAIQSQRQLNYLSNEVNLVSE